MQGVGLTLGTFSCLGIVTDCSNHLQPTLDAAAQTRLDCVKAERLSHFPCSLLPATVFVTHAISELE